MNDDKVEQAVAKEFDRFRGTILGLIESWSLPERQETGAKATVKTLSYDAQSRLNALLKKLSD